MLHTKALIYSILLLVGLLLGICISKPIGLGFVCGVLLAYIKDFKRSKL